MSIKVERPHLKYEIVVSVIGTPEVVAATSNEHLAKEIQAFYAKGGVSALIVTVELPF